jgi:hypothetical protein
MNEEIKPIGKRAEQRAAKGRRITSALCNQNLNANKFSPDALAAIERYPMLASVHTSAQVLTCEKNLDALPEVERTRTLDKFTLQDQDVLAALAEMPPMPERPNRLSADPQLAGLIEAIERHSTPFDLATYNAGASIDS